MFVFLCKVHQHDVPMGSISEDSDQLASAAEPFQQHGKQKDNGGLFPSIFGTLATSSSVTPSGPSASPPNRDALEKMFCKESSSSEIAPLLACSSSSQAEGQSETSVDVVLFCPTFQTESSTGMCGGDRLMHKISARLEQVNFPQSCISGAVIRPCRLLSLVLELNTECGRCAQEVHPVSGTKLTTFNVKQVPGDGNWRTRCSQVCVATLQHTCNISIPTSSVGGRRKPVQLLCPFFRRVSSSQR